MASSSSLSLLQAVLSRQSGGGKSKSNINKELWGSGENATHNGAKIEKIEIDSSASDGPIGLNIFNQLSSRIKRQLVDARHDLIPSEKMFLEVETLLHEKPRLTYDAMVALRDRIPAEAKRFFAAKTFLKFPCDENCSIDTKDFLCYFQRSIDVETTTLNLFSYAEGASSTGMITESELEHYLLDMASKIPALQGVPESACVSIASRRFFFFLDSRRRSQISIKKVAASAIMDELLQLMRMYQYQDEGSSTSDMAELIENNWFSPNNAHRLYSLFDELDKDQKGMLNYKELLALFLPESASSVCMADAALTEATCERIFQETITNKGESGQSEIGFPFKSFIDLILAIENRDSPESILYFWRLIDVDHNGVLSPITISHFYKSVCAVLFPETPQEAPRPVDVQREVYDMLGVRVGDDITLTDIKKSGRGSCVLSMLLDAQGFWNYDNRESLMQTSDNT